MKTYQEFKPTAFDNHYNIDNREGWLVAPVMRTRDSNCLEKSNWDVFLDGLDKESEDTYEIHRFRHWGPGWFEIILVNPNNDALVKIGNNAEANLENYPILDEMHFSQMEHDEALEVWEQNYNKRERIQYIRDHIDQFCFHNFLDLLNCVRGKCFLGYASELIG